jgi:hypothetical protein
MLPPSVAVEAVTEANDNKVELSSVGGPAEVPVVKEDSAE